MQDGRPLRIFVWGNCHAEIVFQFLKWFGETASLSLDVRYARRAEALEVQTRLDDDLLAFVRDCDCVVRQMRRGVETSVVDAAPKTARVVRFPAIRLNWLWPGAFKPHPLDVALPPPAVFYLYAGMADSGLIGIMRREPDPQKAFEAFMKRDPTKLYNLDRHYELTAEAIRSIEASCDVRAWSFVEANWRERRLFWDAGHSLWPYMEVICRQVAHLLPLGVSDASLESGLSRFGAVHRPFSSVHAPLHPRIAEHFGLAWHKSGMLYRHHDEGWFDYEESVRRFIAYAYDADLYRGLAATRQGRLPDGEAALSRALARNPRNVEGWARLSENLWRQKRPEEAFAAIERATAQGPLAEDDYVLLNKLVILEGLRRFDEALAIAERLVLLQPRFGGHHHSRGRVLRALGRQSEALSAFRQACALDPFTGAFARDAGRALLALGRHAEAIPYLERAVSRAPKDADAWHLFAQALGKAGRRAEALDAARTMIGLRDTLRDDWRLLATLAHEAGAFAEAEAGFRRVLALHPQAEPRVWLGLAAAIEAQGRRADAIAALDEARALHAADAALKAQADRLSRAARETRGSIA